MRRRLAIELSLLALAVIVAAGYVLYCYQPRIRAAAWHVLHGDSVTVAGYRIVVPSHWFAEESSPDTPDDMHLWDTKTGESIWFHSFPKPPTFTLAFWSDLEQRRLSDPKSPVIEKRELRVADEPFVCFEKDFAVALPPASSAPLTQQTVHMPSVWCRSGGPLDVTFFGGMRAVPRHDYAEFYSILSSIQKNSR
jgi:hypothetical protein